MSRPPLSYITAYLQSLIALIFLIGYFGLVYCVFISKTVIPENLLELAKMMVISLTNALGLLFAFLYLRSRVDGPPDPATTTTTTSTSTRTTPSPGDPNAKPETTPLPVTDSPARTDER
jgi:hypothetical protein